MQHIRTSLTNISKALYLILLFWLLHSTTNGQNIDISFNTMYSTFSMDGLKNIQNANLREIVNRNGLSAGITQNFPANFGWSLSGSYRRGGMFFTLGGNFLTTGGRISYRDYSGGFTIDQITSRYALMLGVGNIFYENKNLTILGNAFINSSRTSHSFISDYFYTDRTSSTSETDFFAYNGSLLPTISSKYYLLNRQCFIELGAGFEIDILGSPLYLKENSDAFLTNANGGKVKADWSGARIFLGIGLTLNKSE